MAKLVLTVIPQLEHAILVVITMNTVQHVLHVISYVLHALVLLTRSAIHVLMILQLLLLKSSMITLQLHVVTVEIRL